MNLYIPFPYSKGPHNKHGLCTFKRKFVHTPCTFKQEFVRTLCTFKHFHFQITTFQKTNKLGNLGYKNILN